MPTPHPTASDSLHSDAVSLQVGRGVEPRAALELLLCEGDPAQVDGILAAERTGGLSLAGLHSAYRNGRLVGAAWGLVQPGRTALMWPPRLIAGEPDSTADWLLQAADDFVASAGVRLAQSSLPGATGPDAERFLTRGYFHAADLLYLEWRAEAQPREPPVLPVELSVYSPTDEPRLAAIVDRTYLETRDCPELNGVRDPADVLEGYRRTGEFSAGRWLIATAEGQDIGCLLLADHPSEDQWELVYLGVAPEARGRGLGLALTRYAQWLTKHAGRHRLVLAVDARNTPAISIYLSAGFSAFDRRGILLKIL